MIAWIGYSVAVIAVNLYAIKRVYRYSRIAKAAALAEDKHPLAGWDSMPMKLMAGLILIFGVAAVLAIMWMD